MERRQIGLKLVMDQLGLPVKVDSFDDRLVLQKATYLAQAAGLNLGYYYRWYLRGPYCPKVAEDGFAIAAALSQGLDEAKNWSLDASSSAKLGGIRCLLRGHGQASRAKRLELLASVHFLMDRRQVTGRDPRQIAGTLRRFNKLFSESEVASAIREIETHALLA